MQKISFLLIILLTMIFFMASCGEESESDPIDKGLCKNVICQNEGTCNEGKCECKDGFKGDNCEINMNDCSEVNPCLNGGTCINGVDFYTCDCVGDYGGSICQFYNKNSFISTWKTDNEGLGTDKQVVISTYKNSFGIDYGYNYNVDCNNDGVFEVKNQSEDYICNYEEPGTYTIVISGVFPIIHFNITGDKNYKILSLDQWGTQELSGMGVSFDNCVNLVVNAVDTPNLSNVKYLTRAFSNIKSINGDISHWNISSVEDLDQMFSGLKSFNQDISLWDTSKVTSMVGVFSDAESFDQDLSSWNVSNVTNMSSMFSGASSFNQNIGNWDVSNVTNMSFMFSEASSFNQDISSWEVGNVSNMMLLFYESESFNQDLSSWNVSEVTLCGNFDSGATSWTLPKPNFTTCTP